MCDLRMFNKAHAGFLYAKKTFEMFYNDEECINSTAYALQQCVEKVLKAYLECTGVTVPYTHDISKLIRMTHDHGACTVITQWLDDNSEMLTYWETNSRYNLDFTVELLKMKRAISEIEFFFTQNGLTDTLLPAITDDVKKRLQERIPKNRVPRSNFDWNVIYMIYRKHLRLEEPV